MSAQASPQSDDIEKPTVSVRAISFAECAIYEESLITLLVQTVEEGAAVTFLAPLARAKAAAFWKSVFEAVSRGERILVIAEEVGSSGCALGTVQAILNTPENQPHRADIAKMMVLSQARRRGIGEKLMREIERLVAAAGRTLLTLDTETGCAAERLYKRLGFVSYGTIPQYAFSSSGGFHSATFLYKHLLVKSD